MDKPKQIRAVELVKNLFEFIHGNLGLLRFSVEKLEANNGHGQDSDKWIVTCSFYKTLSSQQPTVYRADVNLENNTVTLEEIKGETAVPEFKKTTYLITEQDEKTEAKK